MLTNLWCGAFELIRFKELGHRVIMGHLGTRRSFVAGRITSQSPAAIVARTRLAYITGLKTGLNICSILKKKYPKSIPGRYVPDITLACQPVPNMVEDNVFDMSNLY